MNTSIVLSVLLCLAASGCSAGLKQPSSAPASNIDQNLRSQLESVVRSSGGQLGACFAVLEENAGPACIGQGQSFPMASVYKFPIAVTLLGKVERNEVRLEDPVVIRKVDLRGGRSPIAEKFTGDSQTQTLAQLLEAMIVQSDNTASDLVLRVSGGPPAVSEMLRKNGIVGLRVDRSEQEIGAQLQDGEKGAAAYASDPRDSSTPEAMIALLREFHAGRLLGSQMSEHLRQLMLRAKPDRIALHLPAGTEVAHKTGTANGSFNDVGIVRLPDGRHLAIAILLRGSRTEGGEDGSEIVGKVAEKIYGTVTGSAR